MKPRRNSKLSHSQELCRAQCGYCNRPSWPHRTSWTRGKGFGGALDGTAGRVPQHEDQRTGAELQAAKHAALGMCAGVASVAQDKEVPRKGVKDGFQGHAAKRSLHSLQHRMDGGTERLEDSSSAC